MFTDYKTKNDIPDLYNILGLTIDVCKEPNCNEIIQKAYIKKAKICHPDKHPGNKEVAEVFELLTCAVEILKDERQRNSYNNRLNISKQCSSDYLKLKKESMDHFDSVGDKKTTDQHKLDFENKMKLLDKKHGYDSSIEKVAIPQQDVKKRMMEMEKYRNIQDIEYKPHKLFEDGEKFDEEIFHSAFDKVHKKNEDAVVPHNGIPSAWNEMNNIVNYSDFDNLDNLYVENTKRFDIEKQTYASCNFDDEPVEKIVKDELKNLRPANYVKNHNILGEDYYKKIKEKLKDRQEDSLKFEKMKYDDFKKDDTAGYGIHDNLGIDYNDRLLLDIDDDVSKKFENLMNERQVNNDKQLNVKKYNLR